jgi:7-cyano-7-deazaguanine synthase
MGKYPTITRPHTKAAVIVGNLRAEPTTEYVAEKHDQDQQPYSVGAWSIVHNGTIANDKELRTHAVPTDIDSAAIAERLAENSMYTDSNFNSFVNTVKELKGSYAILAINEDEPDAIYVAANYRPIWYVTTPNGTFFASARHYFPNNLVPKMVAPYTAMRFHATDAVRVHPLRAGWGKKPNTALVVCSGGLDSVVAATYVKERMGMDLHLIHFMYGSRAEGPEVEAVKTVAAHLGAKLTLFPLPIYNKSDSPLLQADADVAGGEAGAEFAHEWVPARNLVLLSVATAFAEAQGIGIIVLGNNLEEAGAYPDNEPEFIAKFNDLLPFAVGDGKRMQVIMPVGNHMKHEIVALGHEIAAPMHLTWSCYRAGKVHCGTCGPCYMRRKAFEINNLPEVIEYVPVN